MVLFLIMKDFATGNPHTIGYILGAFARLSFGGILLGVISGILMTWWLKRMLNEPVLEVNLTIMFSYLVFWIAEFSGLHVSGILAIVGLGFYMTSKGKIRISHTSEESIHHVWSYLGFLAETLIFFLSGIIIGVEIVFNDELHWIDFAKLVALYFFLHVIRIGLILIFLPVLKKMGYGLSVEQAIMVGYAGLRGAVGLSLAIMVKFSPEISESVKGQVMFLTGGIAILTLLINAPTTGFIVKKLGLSKTSKVKKKMSLEFIDKLE
jgi:NhaP-type Na+/H+ or K+/H+ antiporter